MEIPLRDSLKEPSLKDRCCLPSGTTAVLNYGHQGLTVDMVQSELEGV